MLVKHVTANPLEIAILVHLDINMPSMKSNVPALVRPLQIYRIRAGNLVTNAVPMLPF